MLICRVIGHVWATKKEENLGGLKFMMVRDEYGSSRNAGIFVAADVVGAGMGEQVLVVQGSTARMAARHGGEVPVDAAIVAILDSLDTMEEEGA